MPRAAAAWALGIVAGCSITACRKPARGSTIAGPVAAAAAPGRGGAPVVAAEGDKPLLLTFADRDGSFHTVTSVAEVPPYARALVRVVDPGAPTDPSADPDLVYVADLRTPVNGRYPVRQLGRSSFEDNALRNAASASAEPVMPGGSPPGPLAGAQGAAPPSGGKGDIIIYGASWCGACQAAQRYLTEKHIPFIEKDIERDPGAAAEMAEKADRAGLPTGSIPMIDVRGHMVVGFNPDQLDALIGETL